MAGSFKNVSKIRTFSMDAASARENAAGQHDERMSAPLEQPMSARTASTSTPNIPAPTQLKEQEAPMKKALPANALQTQTEPTKTVRPITPVIPKAGEYEPLGKRYLNLEEESEQTSTHHALPNLGDDSTFEVGEGTIIRETKRKRFRLLPAMIQATSGWIEHQKESYDDYRHPYQDITTSDARKDVISAAVAQSAIAPREDFAEVAKRKKAEEYTPIESTLIVKEKAKTPPPQWSYLVGDAQTQKTDEAGTHQSAVSKMPTSMGAPAAQEDAPPLSNIASTDAGASVEATVPTPVSTEKKLEEKLERQQAPHQQLPDIQTVEPTTDTAPAAIPTAPVQESSYTAPTAPAPATKKPRPTRASQTRRDYSHATVMTSHTNTRFRYMLIAVMLLASLSGAGLSVYLFSGLRKEQAQEVAVLYRIPNLIQAQNQQGFTLPSDRTNLLEGLSAFTLQAQGIVQLYPTIQSSEGDERPASAQETLSVLSPRTASSFVRSIREMTFGSISGEPFIILKTGSFDVAFAGMLQWEQTMSADLAPLFGAPVIESFDPSARTDTQVRAAFFKDAIASNKNVRLLFDEQGNDRVVYTFIDQNTILITTTRDALDVLIPLMP